MPLKSLPVNRPLTVVLAGNPNSGKTTLFNALTGLRQKTGNYPGVTVEKKVGRSTLMTGETIDIIDLPGAYSLVSRSPDEHVAMQVLRGLRRDTPAPDVVVVVVDASNLSRNLYLVSQLIELGRPMVVALNMMDIARRRNIPVSAERLGEQLGVPVVEVVSHKKQGINDLKRAIERAAIAPDPDFPLPELMKEQLRTVTGVLTQAWEADEPESGGGAAKSSTTHAADTTTGGDRPRYMAPSPAPTLFVAERLLVGDHAPDIEKYLNNAAVRAAVDAAHAALAERDIDPMQADIEAHYEWIDTVAAASLTTAEPTLQLRENRTPAPGRFSDGPQNVEDAGDANSDMSAGAAFRPTFDLPADPNRSTDERDEGELSDEQVGEETPSKSVARHISTGAANSVPQPVHALEYDHRRVTLTEKLDGVFLHRISGLATFAGIMLLLFVAIFIIADPLMGATEAAIGWFGSLVTGWLPEEGALHDLWADGIVAGVGGVLVFVPQIAMLFLFLAVLEDSGYLARAAFLMDRVLGKFGLNGKSFIPLLSSFACAIPGVMATRTIENRRDRLATIFVAPFMSCSARLPVYTLLIGAFFAGYGAFVRGGIMFACYALGVLAAVGTAIVFRKTFLKSAPTSFVLELPTYKVPQIGQILRVMWSNTSAFVRKAGTVIFALSVILWAMAYYPRLDGIDNGSWKKKWLADCIAAIHIVGAKVMNESMAQAVPQENWNFENVRAVNKSAADALVIESNMTLSADEKLAALWKFTNPDLKEPFDMYADRAVQAAQLEQSISGRLGHFIEPVIRPLGYDWKMGVGLIASFAAREVFVSQMGIVYAAGDTEEDPATLEQAMIADRDAKGRPVWSGPVAISLLVWFVLAMQCMSTVAIVWRETGTWTWPIGQLVYMNALAYVGAFIAYHTARYFMG